MLEIKEIINFLNIKYPLTNVEEWDNVGIQNNFTNVDKEIDQLMICLDLTQNVLKQAIQNKISFIITHHPFIFEEDLEIEIKKNPHKKNMLEEMKDNDICVYSTHTSFDMYKNGTAFQILEQLGIKKFQQLENSDYGLFFENELSVKKLCMQMKKKLKINNFLTNNILHKLDRPQRVGLLPGAGGSEIMISKENNLDLVVTSDIKWSQWILAKEQNIAIIQVPHFIEKWHANGIKKDLKEQFPKINIFIAEEKDIIHRLEIDND